MDTRKSKLNLENLENRQMMAGDVAAYVSGGNLYVNEAPGQTGQDNGVIISQLSNGKIRVSGDFTPVGSGVSKVNGVAFQDFTVTNNLIVKLGAGNDGLAFGSQIAPTFNDVTIDVGAPEPVIAGKTVTNPRGPGGGAIFNQPDADTVDIQSVRTRGSMSVITGPDADRVFMTKFAIGSAPNGHNGNLAINTGAGADNVFLQTSAGSTVSNVFGKVSIQTYSTLSENDHDEVFLQTMLALGDVEVKTGGGGDVINMNGVVSNKKIDITAGTGDDSVTLRTMQSVDGLFARMGEGNDTMLVDSVLGNATLMGEGGSDSLTYSNLRGKNNSLTGWEWINGRLVFANINQLPLSAKVA